jgi:acyl-CoA synthetase (AMP-forming)/AMP-acid ligase II
VIAAPKALRAALAQAGDRVLLRDLSGGTRTGHELAERVGRLAGALLEACGPQPRVGLWYRNGLAAMEAFAAVQWLGGTRVPVDPGAPPAEAAAVFQAAGVKAVLVDAEHQGLSELPLLIHDDHQALHARVTAPSEMTDANAPFMVYPRSVVAGKLFGVTLSYGNWDATLKTNMVLYRSGRYGAWQETSEVFLNAQQLMHGTGFLGAFPFLAMGLPQVVVPSFDAVAIVDTIERHGVTATMLVPPMLTSVLDVLAARSGSTHKLRHVLYGGGPIAAEQIRRAVRQLGPVLTQVYGRVEGGWPLALLDTADHATLLDEQSPLAGSCGRPIAEVPTRLRGLLHEPADIGELTVQSAMSSRDYVDAEGWCSLGDVMQRSADGHLTFQRRLDRMINTGYHVYPDEIEALIRGCDGVDDVLVRGEPHARWGQMVVAHLVAKSVEDHAVLIERVRAALRQRLASYKVPREFLVGDSLPTN